MRIAPLIFEWYTRAGLQREYPVPLREMSAFPAISMKAAACHQGHHGARRGYLNTAAGMGEPGSWTAPARRNQPGR